jgi:hypothetical protein
MPSEVISSHFAPTHGLNKSRTYDSLRFTLRSLFITTPTQTNYALINSFTVNSSPFTVYSSPATPAFVQDFFLTYPLLTTNEQADQETPKDRRVPSLQLSTGWTSAGGPIVLASFSFPAEFPEVSYLMQVSVLRKQILQVKG